MAYRKWKPSKSQAQDFARDMKEIEHFCNENGISQSSTSDSYYFALNGKKYRVSNHTVAASNRAAFDRITGEQKRALYHQEDEDLIEITASKIRIREIYNDLKAGYKLNKRGFRE